MLWATLLQLQLNSNQPIADQLATSSFILTLFKFLFIISAILYVIFSFVVVRQIALMKQTVVTALSPVLQIIGYLHLLLAIGVVIIFFVIL